MRQTFDIPEIHCSGCVMLLEALEEDYPPIRNVRVNSVKKQAEIDYDETQMSNDDVIEAVKEISGYQAVPHVG